MIEQILKWIMKACGVAIVSGLLFYLFFVKGLEWHEAAMAKQTKPPIELRR